MPVQSAREILSILLEAFQRQTKAMENIFPFPLVSLVEGAISL